MHCNYHCKIKARTQSIHMQNKQKIMLAVLGSTTNFDMPPEELEKFKKQHSLNGGSAGGSTEEDEEDEGYPESLVYVNSPKVRKRSQFCVKSHICPNAPIRCFLAFCLCNPVLQSGQIGEHTCY